MAQQAPTRNGFYWLYRDNYPNKHLLVFVTVGDKEVNVKEVRRLGSCGESWEYVSKQDKIRQYEFLTEEAMSRITPKREGYHWITSRDGSRFIIQVNKRREYGNYFNDLEICHWDCVIIGRAQTFSMLSIIQAYQAVRIDFLDSADTDYFLRELD